MTSDSAFQTFMLNQPACPPGTSVDGKPAQPEYGRTKPREKVETPFAAAGNRFRLSSGEKPHPSVLLWL